MRDASRVFSLGTPYAHPKVLGTCTRVRLLPNLGQRGESNPITSLVGLLLQLPWRVATAATIRAALVVATLGDVLLTRCSGSRLRVNLRPTHLIRELASELRGHGATKSALAVGSVQRLFGYV